MRSEADLIRTELAKALSQLLSSFNNLDMSAISPEERAQYVLAREEAAKALIKNRLHEGRPWATSPQISTFFDRWRTLRGRSEAPNASSAAAVAKLAARPLVNLDSL
jgi:hypothetical protein